MPPRPNRSSTHPVYLTGVPGYGLIHQPSFLTAFTQALNQHHLTLTNTPEQASAGIFCPWLADDNLIDPSPQALLTLTQALDDVANQAQQSSWYRLILLSSTDVLGEGAYFCGDCGPPNTPVLRSEQHRTHHQWDPKCPTCGDLMMPQWATEADILPPTVIQPPAGRSWFYHLHQHALSLSWPCPVVGLCVAHPYGWDSTDGQSSNLVDDLRQAIQLHQPVTLPEGGNDIQDCTALIDVAQAAHLALTYLHPTNPTIDWFLISSQTPQTRFELYCSLFESWLETTPDTTAPPPNLTLGSHSPPHTARHTLPNTTKAQTLLHYQPSGCLR